MHPLYVIAIIISSIASFYPQNLTAESKGETLFLSTCGACHSIQPPPKNAPPVKGIVMHYAPLVKDRAEFVIKIQSWAKDPDIAKSHMPGAVTKFGKMPPFPLPDDQLRAIAEWMWDTIQTPKP